ncbi:MAG: iron-containing alcohol dehydrogenase, partial [Planctomycetota bacterium]|nr:iron-containing alcohol dehydrogenase [Planctomycetota bacterium]
MSSSQKSFLGRGALGKLEEVLTETSAESVFLVKSPGVYEASGAHLLVDQALTKVRTRSFDGFTPNPKWPDILSALNLFRKEPCDLILTIGGGSAIDIGKLVSFLALQPAAPEAYLKGEEELSEPVIPLVAIPTTAGSGSETTCFAVTYYEGKKYSIAHEKLLPYCCLVDPALTDGLPPLWSACSGLDAFCQAVESMWAVLSTDESVAHAKKAILLALEHL